MSTDIKHTPGSWNDTFTLGNERGVRSKGGYICFLPKPSRYEDQDERYVKDCEEYKANAKLIAAAPELLEALQWLMDYPEDDLIGWISHSQNVTMTFTTAHIVKAVNAIKKATT